MAKRGKPQTREITNEYFQELLDDLGVDYNGFKELTGLDDGKCEYWAYEGGSPLKAIDTCLALLKTGKSLEELKAGFEAAQLNAREIPARLRAL